MIEQNSQKLVERLLNGWLNVKVTAVNDELVILRLTGVDEWNQAVPEHEVSTVDLMLKLLERIENLEDEVKALKEV
ncbi:MAG: hypothetical protein AAF806_12450 [Bacteroidota bacterium]